MSPTWTSYPQKASRCTQLQCLSLVVAEVLAESLLVWIKKTALWMLLSGWKVWTLFWLQLLSCFWFIFNFLYCCNGSLFCCCFFSITMHRKWSVHCNIALWKTFLQMIVHSRFRSVWRSCDDDHICYRWSQRIEAFATSTIITHIAKSSNARRHWCQLESGAPSDYVL